MKYNDILDRLKSYTPPSGWPGNLFLLPLDVIHDIYEFIVRNKPTSIIELGTGFGTTSCVMAAAMQEYGESNITTVDMYLHDPVNVKVLMQHSGLSDKAINVVADPLGYTWYLADLIKKQSPDHICQPLFDLCLLDGAHEWNPDALAFFLIAKLIKPGGWLIMDDINFNLRMIPNWQESFGSYSDRELDTFQIRMVYDLLVRQHPDFSDFKITHNGRIGWARKKETDHRPGLRLAVTKFLARH